MFVAELKCVCDFQWVYLSFAFFPLIERLDGLNRKLTHSATSKVLSMSDYLKAESSKFRERKAGVKRVSHVYITPFIWCYPFFYTSITSRLCLRFVKYVQMHLLLDKVKLCSYPCNSFTVISRLRNFNHIRGKHSNVRPYLSRCDLSYCVHFPWSMISHHVGKISTITKT